MRQRNDNDARNWTEPQQAGQDNQRGNRAAGNDAERRRDQGARDGQQSQFSQPGGQYGGADYDQNDQGTGRSGSGSGTFSGYGGYGRGEDNYGRSAGGSDQDQGRRDPGFQGYGNRDDGYPGGQSGGYGDRHQGNRYASQGSSTGGRYGYDQNRFQQHSGDQGNRGSGSGYGHGYGEPGQQRRDDRDSYGSQGWQGDQDTRRYGGFGSSHRGDWEQGQSLEYGERAGQYRHPSGQQANPSHPDHDYHQWRNEQLRNLDQDYGDWRRERYGKFSEEFSNWRTQRAGNRGASHDEAAGLQGNTAQRNQGDVSGRHQDADASASGQHTGSAAATGQTGSTGSTGSTGKQQK